MPDDAYFPEAEAQEERGGEARNWAVMCHLSAFVGLLGVPFGWFLGPLVVWLLKRDEFDLVDEQGKEALNFQITVTCLGILIFPLVFVFIGIPMLIALWLVDVVCTVLAAVKTSNGEKWRYPFSFRFLR